MINQPYRNTKLVSSPYGDVYQWYGENKEFYKNNFGLSNGHNGLDIAKGYGTELLAVIDGWIRKMYSPSNSDIRKGYGISLISDYIDLYNLKFIEVLYWHTQKEFPAMIFEKTFVQNQLVIGKEGNSGSVYQGGLYCPTETRDKFPYCGHHVHFQINECISCLPSEAEFYHPKNNLPIKRLKTVNPLKYLIGNFESNTYFGMYSNEVKKLQIFLSSQRVFFYNVTGFFGLKTYQAVRQFQIDNQITPSSGFCGPITRTKINSIINN